MDEVGQAANFSLGDLVEYVGLDDMEMLLYSGHVGRVIDDGQLPIEVCVSLVWGPSIGSSASQFRPTSHDIYTQRVMRMDVGLHPLRDVPVRYLQSEDPEWLRRPEIS